MKVCINSCELDSNSMYNNSESTYKSDFIGKLIW